VYYAKQTSNLAFFATEPCRQVCNFRAQSLLEMEKKQDIGDPKVWAEFQKRLDKLKEDVVGFIRKVTVCSFSFVLIVNLLHCRLKERLSTDTEQAPKETLSCNTLD
jgi:hypothetical protein